jgi:hypothetical protein
MRKLLMGTLACAMVIFSAVATADTATMFTGGMDPQAPQNVQTQLCTLNSGKNMIQYERMFNKYIAWSTKNGVETTAVRSMPFITHSNPNNRSKTEFVEFLVSDHETIGRSWDLWLSTPEGKKLNNEWQSIAQCDVKMATLNTQWANVDALNNDDTRFAMWNWCTRKEGVSIDSIMSKHASIVASYPEGVGNIGWFTYVPVLGGANAPGAFANIIVFPDMAGLMEHKQWLAEGGWRARFDYYNYVDCEGDYVMSEEIIHRPGE